MDTATNDAGDHVQPWLNYTLISTNEEAQALFDKIISSTPNIIAFGFDMESDDIGNFKDGKVSLIQIKLRGEPPYIIDIHGSNIDLTTTRFNDVMKSDNIETIVHDPRNDSKMLHAKYRTEMKRIFDPQSFQMTVEHREDEQTTRRLQGKRKSLDNIYEKYMQKTYPCKKLKSDMKTLMKDKKQNKKLWLRRPLTRDMALYAAFDVETLIPIRDEMDKYLANLKKEDMPAFMKTYNELCQESTYAPTSKKRSAIKCQKQMREFMEVQMLETSGTTLSKEEIRILNSPPQQISHEQRQPPSIKPPPVRRRSPQPIKHKNPGSKLRKTNGQSDSKTYVKTPTHTGAAGKTLTESYDETRDKSSITTNAQTSTITHNLEGLKL